ncbi:hypothetical protein DAEQUDRAFT_46208 [Daedalea quercina L-15889]|uniref:Uncharacterized protein n=1 Tax=Daedalea quercina L-15889 TaxID=1314783 RepID=A0A165LC39_9APHY|nr:hypothetical protein DAEQUDRAFT_46208 [Daedalea quercina L-15889]
MERRLSLPVTLRRWNCGCPFYVAPRYRLQPVRLRGNPLRYVQHGSQFLLLLSVVPGNILLYSTVHRASFIMHNATECQSLALDPGKSSRCCGRFVCLLHRHSRFALISERATNPVKASESTDIY